MAVERRDRLLLACRQGVAQSQDRDRVLLSIAQALQLDEDAAAYLLQLAKPPSPRARRNRRPEKVRDGIRTLISTWPLTPAYVHGTYTDILAANDLATALCPFISPGRNAILDAFTEPEMRELRPDWDVMTAGRPAPCAHQQASMALATSPRSS